MATSADALYFNPWFQGGNQRARTPDGKPIVFASDQAINGEGVRNFDVWIMNADGTGSTQLTVNGSRDTRPAITPDGKYVYFYSNRGARKTDDPAMQIWHIELPKE